MSPIVHEDVPQGEGPNASMPYGDATKTSAMKKEIESRSGTGTPSPPPPGPAPPSMPGMPQGPTQPVPQPDPNQRLDMNQVFPPMPQIQQSPPWRDYIRQQAEVWASHPDAGPAWQRFADLIKNQKGPYG